MEYMVDKVSGVVYRKNPDAEDFSQMYSVFDVEKNRWREDTYRSAFGAFMGFEDGRRISEEKAKEIIEKDGGTF